MMPYVIVGAATSIEELQACMDAVTLIDRVQLARGGVPKLYESGVVYERERRGEPLPGVERFQTARDAYALGHSDCDGLAPWLAAQRQLEGVRARALVVPSNGVGYHVLVEHANGRREDPSAELGMLDGYGIGDDTVASARARRRRRIVELREKLGRIASYGKNLAESGAQASPQMQAARAVYARTSRELRALEERESDA